MTELSAHEDKDAIERRDEAIDLILKHGQHPGNEEKAWVIDQVARILLGYEYESAIQQYNQLSDANRIHQAGPWSFGKTPEPLPSSYKQILAKSTLVFNDEEMAKEWLVSALPDSQRFGRQGTGVRRRLPLSPGSPASVQGGKGRGVSA